MNNCDRGDNLTTFLKEGMDLDMYFVYVLILICTM